MMEIVKSINRLRYNGGRNLIIIGDINVDYFVPEINFSHGRIIGDIGIKIGGTAINAARAFKGTQINPIIFGRVGNDQEGKFILNELSQQDIDYIIGIDKFKLTGECHLIVSPKRRSCTRILFNDTINANDYNCEFVQKAFDIVPMNNDGCVFLTCHFMLRNNHIDSIKYIDFISSLTDRIIVDIVPHDIYNNININKFNKVFYGKINTIISEIKTLHNFTMLSNVDHAKNNIEWARIFNLFACNILVLRSGFEECSIQEARKRLDNNSIVILESRDDTGYAKLSSIERVGFGDILTASFLEKHWGEL